MANLLDYVGLGHFLEKIKTLFVTGLGTSGNNLTWTKNGTTNNITIPYASKSSELIPLQTKQYTGIIGTANNNPGAVFYFMSIRPEDWNKPCKVTYRIYAEMDGQTAGKAFSIMSIVFSRNTTAAYDVWNYIGHTDYRPYYYHYRYLATATGYNNNYGHLMGIGLNSSYSPTTATYARNFTVDVLEATDCTVTLFDTMTKYANVPGTGSTNYSGETTYNATAQGETHTGDNNDVNYQNREYYGCRKTNSALYRYTLCLTKSDGSIVPLNSVSNTVATTKELTSDSFDPFGEIFYWNSTTTYSAGANVGDGSWYRQILFDARYSFNTGGYNATGTLVARSPVYLVAVPSSDGTAVLNSTPLAQALPTEDNGLIYIYLGRVYPDSYPYRIALSLNHPIYHYKDGAVRQWNGRQFITQETDPVFSASAAAGITSSDITNWNGKVSKVTSTDNAVVRFDGTSGTVQNSGVTINDSNHVTAAKFITSGGAASQVVCGDGSLKAAKQLPQYEAFLEWGGKNFSGSYGPIDAAMVGELGANRLAFLPANNITVQYCTDGETWLDYEATDEQKVGLVSGLRVDLRTGHNTIIDAHTTGHKLRVILTQGSSGLYTSLNKFILYVTCANRLTAGINWCTIEGRTRADYNNSTDNWSIIAERVAISGWSGYNVINTTNVTFGSNSAQTYQIRFTIGMDSAASNSASVNPATTYGISLISLFAFGGVGWSIPSKMAGSNHLYDWDYQQTMILPGNIRPKTNNTKTSGTSNYRWSNIYSTLGNFSSDVTANKFIKSGGTASQFLKADGSVDSTSYGTYSKPSGGIPKTDLASTVQTSLGKADTALQSFTETDPTVPSWAKQSSKPTYTAQEVGALPSTTSIPSKTSDLTNDSGFITSSDISGVYKYKGTKTNYSNLPTSGNVTGDVWNVTNANGNIPAGTNYAWNGSAWDALGGSVDLSGYVPTSRTINGKALTSNITLSASDVSALPSSTTIPTALADLTDDSTHRLVTDTEKSTWNGKQSPATTLAGYGITDAKIQNGVITLGSNSITPLTSHQSLSNYVTLNGAQSITGEKTFTGDKRIKFKQGTAADKLGFTLYDQSNVEVGYLEWQSSGLNSKPTLVLGQWISQQKPSTPGYLGFKLVNVLTATRYMLVTPLLADAKTPLELNDTIKTFYFPLQFKNGTNTVLTDNAGVVDLATLLQAYELASNKVTSIDSSSTDNQYPSAKCVYDAIQNNSSGDYIFTEGEDIYGDFTPINNGYGFVQGTGNYNDF